MKGKIRRLITMFLSFLMLVQMIPLALAATLLSNEAGGGTYYEVVFSVDGTPVATQLVADGGNLALPEAPSKAGSQFVGWADTGGTMYTDSTPVRGNLLLTARFENVDKYAVTIRYQDTNDHQVANDVICQYRKADVANTIISPSPVLYNGKILYPERTSVTITPSELTKDTTIIVRYFESNATYTVLYMGKKLNDSGYDEISRDTTLKGVIGNEVTPAPITIPGYSFEKADSAVLQASGTEIKVYYTRNVYTVNFGTNGGTYVSSQIKQYGDTLNVAGMTSTKAGYTFGGWYTSADLSGSAVTSVTVKQDTTLYAKWNPALVRYTIVYMIENANDSSFSYLASNATQTAATGSTVTVTAGSSLAKPSALDSVHFTFKEASTETVAADGSTVVTVKYSRKVYTLKSNSIFGGVQLTLSAKYGETITGKMSAWNTATGGQYAWAVTQNNEDKVAVFDTMSDTYVNKADTNGNITVYNFTYSTTKKQTLNYWLENYPSTTTKAVNGVTYGLYKAVDVKFNYLYYDTDFYEIAGYTKGSYDGIANKKNFENGNRSTTFDGQVVNFYYLAKSYPLSLYNYDGTLISTNSVKLNTLITGYLGEPVAAYKPAGAMTFGGWYVDPARQTPNTATIMPTGLALYADWKFSSYAVSFNLNGGTGEPGEYATQTIGYKRMVQIPADPSKDGNDFTGWYTDQACTARFDTLTQVTASFTLYAGWTASKVGYTVRYLDKSTLQKIAADKTVGAALYRVGDTVTEAAPIIAGYDYDSADPENGLTLTSITAQNILKLYYVTSGAYPYKVVHVYYDADGNVQEFAGTEESYLSNNAKKVVAYSKSGLTVGGVEYYAEEVSKTLTLNASADASTVPENNVITFTYHPYIARSITIHYYYANVDGSYTDFDPDMTETVTGVRIGHSVKVSDHLAGKDKTGFTFDSESTVPSYVTAVKGADELILKIYFKRNRHTIFYTIDGEYYTGEYKKIENVRYGTALSPIADDMTKEGYTFSDWNGLPSTMPDSDVTVTGHYTINSYDVTYEYTGAVPAEATAPGLQNYNYQANVTVAPLPSVMAGYTFHGWTIDGNSIGAGDVFAMPSHSMIIKGDWTKNGTLAINWDSANTTYTGVPQSLITFTTPSGSSDNGKTFTWQQLQTAGYSIDQIKNGKGTHVGTYVGLVTGPSIVAIGGVIYDVIYTYDGQTITTGAKLAITPVQLKVTTPDANKVYNGKALTAEGSITGFVNGETAIFATTGTQTAVGSSLNTYSLSFNETTAAATDYAVSENVGTLTVTEYADEIVVTTTGGAFTYDGNAHGATVTVSELPEGYTLEEASSNATATHVTDGTVPATYTTLVIKNAADVDVTSQLHIVKVDGSITIKPAELKVTTPDANKVYNGKALTAEGSITGFVNGETAIWGPA